MGPAPRMTHTPRDTTPPDTTSADTDEVADWAELVPKRAYVLRSPEGEDELSTYGGPGETPGSAVFFAHSADSDGELTIAPGDGWTVLRSVHEDA